MEELELNILVQFITFNLPFSRFAIKVQAQSSLQFQSCVPSVRLHLDFWRSL